MSRVKQIQVWTDWPFAGVGTFLGELAATTQLTRRYSISDGKSAQLTIPKLSKDRAIIRGQRVVRFVFEGAEAPELWRVKRIRDPKGLDAKVTLVELAPPEDDLADATVMHSFTGSGVAFFDEGLVQTLIAEYVEDELLPALSDAGQDFWELGACEITQRIDVDWSWANGRQFIEGLLAKLRELAIPCEFYTTSSASAHQLNFVAAIGSSVPDIDVSIGRQLNRGERLQDFQQQMTRAFVRGDGDAEGVGATIAEAVFRVTAVDGGGSWIEVEDPEEGGDLIAFDNQYQGLRLVKDAATFASVAITSSVAATQRMFLSSVSGISVGHLVYVKHTDTVNGEDLVSVTHPAMLNAWGDRARAVVVSGMHGLRNWGKNADNADYPVDSSPPTGWSLVSGGTGTGTLTVQKNTNPQWIKNGAFSAKLELAAPATFLEDCGMERTFHVHPRSDQALHSITVWLFLAGAAADSGALKLFLRVLGGSVNEQIETEPNLPLNQLYRLTLPALNLLGAGTNAFTLRFWCGQFFSSGMQIYFDSYMIARRPLEDPPFARFSDANRGIHIANKMLAEFAPPIVEYSAEFRDLELMDPARWSYERLQLGAHLRVRDPEIGGPPVRHRILSLEPGQHAADTRVQLSSRKPLVTDFIG